MSLSRFQDEVCNYVGMWNAPEVVREVGVHDFRVATEQQLFHLDHRLLGVSPGAIAGFCLRFRVQRHLQFLNTLRSG